MVFKAINLYPATQVQTILDKEMVIYAKGIVMRIVILVSEVK
uniref:Uncharacterized protein n=1 Tax=Setaria italica TaxID=4555 RepID=K3YP27_SETIT